MGERRYKGACWRGAVAVALACGLGFGFSGCALRAEPVGNAGGGPVQEQVGPRQTAQLALDIMADIEARGLAEQAEGLQALKMAETDDMARHFNYVWTGSDGTRWNVSVNDGALSANPIGHAGQRLESNAILSEDGVVYRFDSEARDYVPVEEAGLGDYEVVRVDVLDATALDEWAQSNVTVEESAGSVERQFLSSEEDEGEPGDARAPAGEEGASDER